MTQQCNSDKRRVLPIEREGTVGYNIFHNGETLSYYIPKEVDSLFDEEFDASELRNYSDLLNLAASAFVELLSTSEPHVGTGGGAIVAFIAVLIWLRRR